MPKTRDGQNFKQVRPNERDPWTAKQVRPNLRSPNEPSGVSRPEFGQSVRSGTTNTSEPQRYAISKSIGKPKKPEYTLSEVQKRVEEATRWRKDAKYDATWTKLIKLYGNKYEYPELTGTYEDVIAPNMLFSTANVIAPSISVNYPKITVKARRPEDGHRAANVEAVANYEWQHNDVHEEFRLAVKDFVVLGHGWCKTSWKYEEDEVDWDDQSYTDEVMRRLQELEQTAQQTLQVGGSMEEIPTAEMVIDQIPKKRTVVIEDRPVVERVSPQDMFVDPDATRLGSALWIAQRQFIPIKVAKEREDWNKKAREAISPMAMSEAKKDREDLFEGEERGKDPDYAVVWEYYDLVAGTVCTFAEGCSEGWLADPEPSPLPFTHPFVMLRNYDIPDKFYPMGDVEAIMSLQMELATTRTQMINDRKRFRRMYMVHEDGLTEDGMNALLGGDDNAIITVQVDKPFSEIVAPVQTTPLPPEFYNQTAMILDDINLVSGVTEYQRGAVSEIRRTATEASLIQDGANARAADKLAIIERAIGEVASRVVQLTQVFLTTDTVIRIVGQDGAPDWIQYTAQEVMGEYDFTVEAGSTQPQNESTRRQAALQLMDSMAPFIGTVIDPRKMAEYVLREGFGVKNPQEFLIDQEVLIASGINPATGQPLPPEPMPGEMPPGGGGPGGPPPPQM